MEEKSIRRGLYKVLRKTGIQRSRIIPCASFIEDLHFDQLDWKLFVYYLEDLFKIRLIDSEIESFVYVSDVIHLLDKRLSIECS